MRNYSFRALGLALLLIVGGSMSMHTFIFSRKKNLHYRHHEHGPMAPAETFVPAGPPVEGSVAALGLDRIHVFDSRSNRATFRCQSPGQYKIGQRLRITFAPGAPPTAIKIEKI